MRELVVPPGYRIVSGYVSVFKIRLGCRSRMAVGDVERAYRKVLKAAPSATHPTPNGKWIDDVFEIADGRHEYIAKLMLGFENILVTWLEPG